MGELFEIGGQAAILGCVGAGITGFFGPALRRRFGGPPVLRLHRAFGLLALGGGLLHVGLKALL
jgi:hypothetical protein